MADAKSGLQQGVEGGCWTIWLCNLFRSCIQITDSLIHLYNILSMCSSLNLTITCFLVLSSPSSHCSTSMNYYKLLSIFSPRLCQLPTPWSHQRSSLLKHPWLCFTPSSFLHLQAAISVLPLTIGPYPRQIHILKETALCLHILNFFYNSHATKDFSINSERQPRNFLRPLSLKLSFTVMFTKRSA